MDKFLALKSLVLEPDFSLVLAATAMIVMVALLVEMLAVARAIRAKLRAHALLQNAALMDDELQRMQQSASAGLTAAQLELIRRKVEVSLSMLPERDRHYVEQGINQHSAVGAQRYIKELIAA